MARLAAAARTRTTPHRASLVPCMLIKSCILVFLSVCFNLLVGNFVAAIVNYCESTMNSNSEDIFRIGIVADTQYADTEDGYTFDKTSVRRYRQSLSILEQSVIFFSDKNVSYCVQLGDVLDSRTKRLQMQNRCLDDVLAITNGSNLPWSFCVGNHDLESISREQFHSALIPAGVDADCHSNKLYYDISPIPGFRFIFIDGYEVSTQWATSEAHAEQARALLRAKNKNVEDPHGDWFVDLAVEDMKYVPYNGAVGAEQLEWVRQVLLRAKVAEEKVLLFSHMPLLPACCRPSGLLWNSDELLAILHAEEVRGVVLAVFAGHDHDGLCSADFMSPFL